MNKTDLAYIAGLVDGEGSIYTSYQPSRVQELPRYNVGIAIQMADKEPLAFLQSLFGGRIILRKKMSENRKPLYYWRLTNFQAQPLLEAIKPYLLVKRAQAEIALRMLNAHKKWRHYSPIERFLQEADALAIKELNK